MTKLAEQLLLTAENEASSSPTHSKGGNPAGSTLKPDQRQYYVRVVLSGKKPDRFKESTTVPTFLEWNTPCICRVPKWVVDSSLANAEDESGGLEEIICQEFSTPIREGLLNSGATEPIQVRTCSDGLRPTEPVDSPTTFIDVSFVNRHTSGLDRKGRDDASGWRPSKHFVYRKVQEEQPDEDGAAGSSRPSSPKGSASLVEMTVAHPFPCALSRQRSLLTSEFTTVK